MVQLYPDRETLARAAADLFAAQAGRAVELRGRFLALLSGGETPRASYRLLAQEPLLSAVPWDRVQLFWGDERWVPLDDPRSNFCLARRDLLDRVPLAPSQVHPIPYASSPRQSAHQYEELLRANFPDALPRFDLAFLGLGEDGHTASLFPGSPALAESSRWVSESFLSQKGMYRVTLTPLALNGAALVAFLVAGAGKAEVLSRVLEQGGDPSQLPALAIRPRQGRLLWLVDREAGRLLKEETLRRP